MTPLNTYESWLCEWCNNNIDKLTMSLLVITISLVIMLSLSWYKSLTSPQLPPGPYSLPVVGYLPFLGRDVPNQLANMANTYGPIFKLYLGSKLLVVINTPELAKVVVREQDDTFANRGHSVVGSVISYGGQDLVLSDNTPTWRTLRKIFVHEVLSNKNLKACSFFRTDEVRKTIKNVFSKIGTSVDISEIAFLTEANVITRMVWDDTSYTGEKGYHLGAELRTVACNIAKIAGQANLSDFFPTLAWFDLQGLERNMKKEIKKLDQIFTNIIEDRIKSNSKTSQDGAQHDGKKDFLQILLDLMDQNDATSLTITQVKALLTVTKVW